MGKRRPMKRFEAISALAGAGKTYQLTKRYIWLLSMDVPPESILAITFTQKAAAELFDRIVSRLANALIKSGKSDELSRLQKELQELHGSGYTLKKETVLDWLKKILAAIPRLRIGTIDSLFVSMVNAFAFELGMPSRIRIVEDTEAPTLILDVLDLLWKETDANLRVEQLNLLHDITQGPERQITVPLVEQVEALHSLFLMHPNKDEWGSQERIWKRPPWWQCELPTALCSTEDLFNNMCPADAPGRFRDAVKKWIRALEQGEWKDKGALGERVLDTIRTAGENPWTLAPVQLQYYSKTYTLSRSAWEQILLRGARLIREEAIAFSKGTQAWYRFLSEYEKKYHELIRSSGMVTFADLPHVLLRAKAADVHLDIDYRLDGAFRHWLIDEFQDTSVVQWQVLENAADEVFQSGDSFRTFCYVGDPKQAIYGWRGGEASLFDTVRLRYRQLFGDTPTTLPTSWRSSPAILEVVNKLFSPENITKLLEERGFEDVANRWREHWTDHKAPEINRDRPGYVELHLIDRNLEEPTVVIRTCELARSLYEQGVDSIAVLVRLNRFGDEIAEALRKQGIPVTREAQPQLLDNNVVSALLSILFLADHPDDQYSFEHAKACGVVETFNKVIEHPNPLSSQDEIAAAVREFVYEHGVVEFIERIIQNHDRHDRSDFFLETRVQQLLREAVEYERAGHRSPSEFALRAERLVVKDPVTTGGVVVTTIHKAKGLDYDAVILPDLRGRNREMNKLPSELILTGENGDPWILFASQPKWITVDRTIKSKLDEKLNQRVYEELCLLYVAVTRAKYALYFVTEGEANPSEKLYPADLILDTLLEERNCSDKSVWAWGDPNWLQKVRREEVPREPRPSLTVLTPAPLHLSRRLIATSPSETEKWEEWPAVTLFDPEVRASSERGKLVHELFQQLAWYDRAIVDRLCKECVASAPPHLRSIATSAAEEFAAALQQPEIRTLFEPPQDRAELWREQAFELADGDRWITGRIDRVVIEQKDDGSPLRATLLDFKTDHVDTPDSIRARVEFYRRQMNLYVQAVARLTQLPLSRIRALLVFTHPRVVVEV